MMKHPETERIDELLHIRADQRADALFLLEGERSTSYAVANRITDRIARWLQRSGVGTGDRVVLLGDNSTDFLLVVFGILRVGATVVPLHAKTPTAVLTQVLEQAEPIILLADRPLLDKFLFTQSSTCIALDELRSLPDGLPTPTKTKAESACIIFTSGSTGIPQGVICGHGEIMFAIHAINQVLGQTQDDRILCCLPFSFDYGLYQSFLALDAGATLVIASSQPNPLALPALLQQHRITGFPLVPSLAVALLRSRMLERIRLDTLRYATNTGDLLPIQHVERLSEQLGGQVVPMYGLTECKRVAIMPLDRLSDKPGSVGLPLPGTRVDLLPDAELVTLGTDVGELLVQGPHVMKGYWRDPTATANRFRKSTTSDKTTLYTGDLFRRDADGFLFFLGRKETLIRLGNQVFAPAELEQRLANLDAVEEVAVIRRTLDTEARVEVFIVTDRLPKSVQQPVENTLADIFASNSNPFTVHFLKKMPRTLNGKIDRVLLAKVNDAGASA